MTRTLSTIAAVSLLAQAVFFVGFGFLVADLLGLPKVITPGMREGSLFPFIRETVASYQAVLWPGFAGAIICGVIYIKKAILARWFLAGARAMLWFWFLLVSISIVVGVVLVTRT